MVFANAAGAVVSIATSLLVRAKVWTSAGTVDTCFVAVQRFIRAGRDLTLPLRTNTTRAISCCVTSFTRGARRAVGTATIDITLVAIFGVIVARGFNRIFLTDTFEIAEKTLDARAVCVTCSGIRKTHSSRMAIANAAIRTGTVFGVGAERMTLVIE